MQLMFYLLFAFVLILIAYVILRQIVRRSYLHKGKLTTISSILQLLAFVGLMGFPYLYNPPEWPWF